MEEKYTLNILGENLSITSDQGHDYVKDLYNAIADHIDKIEDVDKNSTMSKMVKSLYISVFLADDLMKARREIEELQDKLADDKKTSSKPKNKKG
ncbi:MAG: cell division protein ZapA [Defluviitaleaceae bacterium]|nr:cell division protein ZapA [Defluviitaleaceae bacterium]